MDRRSYLTAVGTASVGLVAGCLGRAQGNTVLSKREDHPASEDLPYPAYGQELPESTLPAPLENRTISTASFEGKRTVVMTFFFTSCPDGVCPALIQALRHAQADAAENGYSDGIALIAATFDPQRDTAAAIRQFAEKQNVDYTAGNWHFLRPKIPERAHEVIGETYGVDFRRIDTDTLDTKMTGMGEYTFDHLPLTFLVNESGYIERAYSQVPQPSKLIDDFTKVVNASGNG